MQRHDAAGVGLPVDARKAGRAEHYRQRAGFRKLADGFHEISVRFSIAGDQAVFVRLMDRSSAGADPGISVRAVERTVDLVSGWTDLNEFKHTSIPR